MWLYTFADFEEAYFKNDVERCQIIGVYLLGRLSGDTAKELTKKLLNLHYKWDAHQDELQKVYQLLSEVKRWLQANL